MTTIGEIIHLDPEAALHSDVQLAAYKTADNMKLLKSYLFTSTSPAGKLSSLQVLERAVGFYTPHADHIEPRQVIIADYGHGKSHLGLALANFFSKPLGTPESNLLLDKIGTAGGKDHRGQLEQFKRDHPRHMVILLRGDAQAGALDQFHLEVKRLLAADPETKGIQLTFWLEPAIKWMENLSQEDIAIANGYLGSLPEPTDTARLLARLRSGQLNLYETVGNLSAQLNAGTRLDFGGNVGFGELIEELFTHFIGAGKPYCGLLILFDEFTSYLVKHQSEQGLIDQLQDLANGVFNHRGKASVLCFAQQDPQAFIATFVHDQHQLAAANHVLTRYPGRILLSSQMESVIDSYMQQETGRLTPFITQYQGPFTNACYIAFEAFKRRYRDDFSWSSTDFQERVGKGCFPLHPLTTSILCTMSFAQSGIANPRTALQFAMDMLEIVKKQEIVTDNKLNWILPHRLVDYFKDQLPREDYQFYESILERLGEEKNGEKGLVLKGLFLQTISKMQGDPDEQIDQIVHITGLSDKSVRINLIQLHETEHLIAKDTHGKFFLPRTVGGGWREFDDTVRAKTALMSVTSEDIRKIRDNAPLTIQPNITWGKPDDWAPRVMIIPASDLTIEFIHQNYTIYRPNANGYSEGQRGLVIFLIAKDDNELEEARAKSEGILKTALEDNIQIPMVVVIPEVSSGELYEKILRLKAIDAFSADERQRYQAHYATDRLTVISQIEQILKTLHLDSQRVNLVRQRSSFKVIPSGILSDKAQVTLREILEAAYKKVYSKRPSFYTQYDIGNLGLRKAVQTVAIALKDNSIETQYSQIQPNPIATFITNQFLKQNWEILDSVASLKIQPPPEGSPIFEGWRLLDEEFQPDQPPKSPAQVLSKLMNPPFGYDVNVLTLLFCAWVGYYQSHLNLDGEVVHSIDDLGRCFGSGNGSGPEQFIRKMCTPRAITIARRRQKDWSEVQIILRAIKSGGLSVTAARTHLAALKQFAQGDDFEEHQDEIQAHIGSLIDELQEADEYQRRSESLAKSIRNSSSPDHLLELRHEVGELPSCRTVCPDGPSVTELKEQIRQRLLIIVDERCREAEHLSNYDDYGSVKKELEGLRKFFLERNEAALADKVDSALVVLETRRDDLKRKERAQEVRDSINQMSPATASLATLYQFRERLEGLGHYDDETDRKRDFKLVEVKKRISEIESQVEQVLTGLWDVDDLKTLNEWYTKYQLAMNRAVGTPCEGKLKPLLSQYANVATFLQALSDITSTVNADSVSRAVISQKRDELESLRQKYGKVEAIFVAHHIEKTTQYIDRRVETLEQQSIELLEALEGAFSVDGANLQLLNQLKRMPAFLPVLQESRWRDLDKRVRTAWEADKVDQILKTFDEIEDPARQEMCLQLLLDKVRNRR
jgi:hypothetical protein